MSSSNCLYFYKRKILLANDEKRSIETRDMQSKGEGEFFSMKNDQSIDLLRKRRIRKEQSRSTNENTRRINYIRRIIACNSL